MNNPSTKTGAFALKGVIDRLEGDKAVIKTADHQELQWPRTELPPDLGEGDLVELALGVADSLSRNQQEQVAREMLKQILHTD